MSRTDRPTPAQIYDEYFVPGNFARWVPALLDRVAPGPGERVLDLACGTGIVARQAAPLVGEGGEVIGQDVNSDMLSVARGLPEPPGARIGWRQGDATDLPEGPFEVVTCQQGFQFFPNRSGVVAEMRRAQPPGGRVGISVWRGLDEQPLYRELIESEARHLDSPIDDVAGPAFSLGDPAQLHRHLEEAGYERIEIDRVSRTVRFPDPQRFVRLTVLAAAAVIPALGAMNERDRGLLVDAVDRDVEATLERYTDGDAVEFPMHANVALAHAPDG